MGEVHVRMGVRVGVEVGEVRVGVEVRVKAKDNRVLVGAKFIWRPFKKKYQFSCIDDIMFKTSYSLYNHVHKKMN